MDPEQLAHDQPPRPADGPLPQAGCCPDGIGLPPGHLNAFTFRILDYTGQLVTSLVEQRGGPGHLILVRCDQSGSQQPRPTMPIDGT
jgi:hypothetical protein